MYEQNKVGTSRPVDRPMETDVKRKPQVQAEFDRMASLVASMTAKIEALETTLSPILNQNSGKDASGEPTVQRCPLAQEIRDLADRLDAALSRLTGIEDRIEL